MDPSSIHPLEPREAPWVAVPASYRPRPRRRRLHVVLLAATAVTLAIAGGVFWEGVLGPDWLRQLLRPELFLRAVTAGAPYAVFTVLILGAHEMGHYLACRYYGIPATLPFFLPGIPPLGSFGAVIRIRGTIPDRKALFDIAAAGPLAGFVLALPLLVAGVMTAEPAAPALAADGGGFSFGSPLGLLLLDRWLAGSGAIQVNSLLGAGWVGMLVTSLNLFPVGQLDGGHLAYAVSRRLHRTMAFTTIVGVFLLVMFHVLVLAQPPAYVVWFAILIWMRDRHPRLRDETGRLGPVRTGLAVLLFAVFLFALIPVPIWVTGP